MVLTFLLTSELRSQAHIDCRQGPVVRCSEADVQLLEEGLDS